MKSLDDIFDEYELNDIDNFFTNLPKLSKDFLETIRNQGFRARGMAVMLVKRDNELFDSFKENDYQNKSLERLIVVSLKESSYDHSLVYSHFDLPTLIKRAKENPSSFKFILEKKTFQKYFDFNYLSNLVKTGYLNPLILDKEKDVYERNVQHDKNFAERYKTFEDYFFSITIPMKYQNRVYGIITLDSFENVNPTKGYTQSELNRLEGIVDEFTKRLSGKFKEINKYMSIVEQQIKTNKIILSKFEKPPFTLEHSERVKTIYVEFLRHLFKRKLINATSRTFVGGYYGALFHDIGKVLIDPEILNKPGKLTYEEFEKIKEHPMLGYDLIKSYPLLEETFNIVKYHHFLNGKGYPEDISKVPDYVGAFSIVDIFDALTSERSYKKAYTVSQSFEELDKMVENGMIDNTFLTEFKELIFNSKEIQDYLESNKKEMRLIVDNFTYRKI